MRRVVKDLKDQNSYLKKLGIISQKITILSMHKCYIQFNIRYETRNKLDLFIHDHFIIISCIQSINYI